jgi:hypothetical protein
MTNMINFPVVQIQNPSRSVDFFCPPEYVSSSASGCWNISVQFLSFLESEPSTNLNKLPCSSYSPISFNRTGTGGLARSTRRLDMERPDEI